ncbi:hypothetical protein HDV02_002942 [Globomyces sp. JEL0801]|nr:hypothetical protein HDV02_002942 [Globomyces sp. JEL0801]
MIECSKCTLQSIRAIYGNQIQEEKTSKKMPINKLITIPASHYCEKARWMLQLAGIPFEETGHAPAFHLMSTTLNNGKSVPLLVLDESPPRYLNDSNLITEECSKYLSESFLTPEVKKMELELGNELGPHARRMVYHFGFEAKNPEMLLNAITKPIESSRPIESFIVQSTFTWVLKPLLQKGMNIDEEKAMESLKIVEDVFSLVEQQLQIQKETINSNYLFGSTLTAADITFASLASIVVMPQECSVVYDNMKLIGFQDHHREILERIQQRDAAKFVRFIYKNHRFSAC